MRIGRGGVRRLQTLTRSRNSVVLTSERDGQDLMCRFLRRRLRRVDDDVVRQPFVNRARLEPREARAPITARTLSRFRNVDGTLDLPEHRVVIRKSLTPFRIVQPKNRNYIEVLREKLRWGK